MKTIQAMSVVVLSLSASVALAQVPSPSDPGLLGITHADTWKDLKSSNYTTFPVVSNEGSASLTKTAGGAFFASSSLYGGYSTESSEFDLNVASALSSVKTVVFQAKIGQGYGDFSSQPVLNYTTSLGTGTITATQQVLAQETTTSAFGDVLLSLYKYQFDLSDISSPVTSFKVSYGQSMHSQLYNIRLDQSTYDYSAPVPEPASLAVLGLGVIAFIKKRKQTV